MKKNTFSLMAVMSFMLVITFCSNNYFGRALTRNSSNTPDPADVTIDPITVPPGGDPNQDYFQVTSGWTQPLTPSNVWPEILFVIDTSGSMSDEKNAVVSSLGGWLTNLRNQGVENFCVDVMESTTETSKTGRLIAKSGNPKCVCTDQYGIDAAGIATIVSKFQENINYIFSNAEGGEMGIYSLNQALNDPAKLAANQADGCFRSTMALVPLLISDENDHGATVRDPSDINCTGNTTASDGSTVAWNTVDWDNSTFPELDGVFVTSPVTAAKYVHNTCDEEASRLRYYSEATPGVDGKYNLIITPTSVATALEDYNNSLPTFGTGIVYNSTTFPVVGHESKGWGYLEFADALGKDTVNLATTSNQTAFNAEMSDMGTALAGTLTYNYKFVFIGDPVCSTEHDSVSVKINGTTIPSTKWAVNAAGTYLKFKASFNWAPYGPGADVQIKYITCP